MRDNKSSKKRRIIYLSLLAVALIAVGVITAVALSSTPNNGDDANVKPPVSSLEPAKPSSSTEKPDDSGDQIPDDSGDKPVVEVISFVMPVAGGNCIKGYTDSTVVFSSTLGIYTGHLAMDFSGEEGAFVVAAYGGTVKEITTGYLEGTTVKIDHGKGLVTCYNSIEPIEGLKVGDKVGKGQQIGVISTNNKQEYKDGPHLHFEVFENGVNVTPLKYLAVEEK